MRTLLSITLLLAVIFVAGCSQSGDFGAFVVAQVTKYGGHTKTTAPIPKLDARWKLKEDANGFQAFVTGVPFAIIAADMEQVFGTPKTSHDVGDTLTVTPLPYRLWSAVDIGVAIQLIGHEDSTEVICIRGVKDMDELLKHIKP
jgi:hypothetical protein